MNLVFNLYNHIIFIGEYLTILFKSSSWYSTSSSFFLIWMNFSYALILPLSRSNLAFKSDNLLSSLSIVSSTLTRLCLRKFEKNYSNFNSVLQISELFYKFSWNCRSSWCFWNKFIWPSEMAASKACKRSTRFISFMALTLSWGKNWNKLFT